MLPELHIQHHILVSSSSVINCAWPLNQIPEQVVLRAWELAAPCIAHTGVDDRHESCSVIDHPCRWSAAQVSTRHFVGQSA